AARAAGGEIIGEVELAARYCGCPLLALTGTNGKTTSITMLGEIFAAAGINAFVGGNIGRPAVEMIGGNFAAGVLELSSFQLESMDSFRPQVAVILNLTPDHQDRYPAAAAYLEAKTEICRRQRRSDYLILNQDDTALADFGHRLVREREAGAERPAILFFSLSHEVDLGAAWLRDEIVIKLPRPDGTIVCHRRPAFSLRLPGAHNRANALAVLLAALVWGVDESIAVQVLTGFSGIAHRLEYVGCRSGVNYYNDSKATNIDAVLKALASFTQPLVLLLGGYDKGADFTLLRDFLSGNLRCLIPFGQAATTIARQLPELCAGDGAEKLAPALDLARQNARPGDVVLLAPGCASFDEFKNYEERGDCFRRLVQNLEDAG
ncbi:MAG TPA: UDP-N-acetylmuramoyl-L-alanine--D-glutamate ligase, partial [Proteobacteria bacterium]|nr:UDP-N-acetylmuramoyl-L-alanine--D-glutamate ligase [Pseudomonadota bacterium]